MRGQTCPKGPWWASACARAGAAAWAGVGALIAALSILASPAQAASPQSGRAAGPATAAAAAPVWRYGVLAGYPPFQIWPEGGWPGGADLDLLRAAAAAQGGRIEPVRYTDFSRLLADLQTGRLDVASAMSRTAERERTLAFGPPYARIEQVMVVRAADGDVPLMADLAGRRIAVVASYASASQVARLFPLAPRVEVADVEAGLRAVAANRADLFIEAAAVIGETLDRLALPELRVARTVVLGSNELHLAAGSAGAARLAPLAAAVDAQGAAHRAAAIARWTATTPLPRLATLSLAAEERQVLAALQPLRIAVVDGQAPFQAGGSDGRPRGLAVDALASALNHLRLPTPDWQLLGADAALAALRDGRVDLALGLPEAASRTSGIGFAGPFIEHPLVLVARRGTGLWSLEQMAGRRLAMPTLQVPQTLLLARFPRVVPVACDTIRACLQRVEEGEADALTADVVSLALELSGGRFTDLQIVGTAGDLRHERGVAVAPGLRTLLPLLQRALDVSAVADMPAIKQRWLERPPPQKVAVTLLQRALPWALGALAVLIVAWWWHGAGLRAEVARTQAARRDAERAATAANRFIAFLAHEVRNSLHSVIAAVELLRGEKGVTPAVVEPLGQSARSTLALLNSLLDRERLSAGALTLDPGPARLGALVDSVVLEMRPAARLAGVTMRLLPSEDRWLRVDALRVQQVLRNLLSNAIKYAGPGDVTVGWTFEPAGDGATGSPGAAEPAAASSAPVLPTVAPTLPAIALLLVCDNGPGLAAAQRDTLFQAFQSGTGGRTDSAGLGLALSRDLARTLGGDLVLDSPPDGGVVASFRFIAEPLAAWPSTSAAPDGAASVASSVAPSVASSVASSTASPGRFAAGRVLVVEDAEVYAMLLRRALEGAGWQVDVVGSVADARQRLMAQPYELLLTDLNLPDGNAAAVLDVAVRPGLRRVVMTAELDEQARSLAGVDRVVAKLPDVQLFVDRLLDPSDAAWAAAGAPAPTSTSAA